MSDILGVHGIRQGRSSAGRLRQDWADALHRGWPDDAPRDFDIVVPHLSPLLRPRHDHLGVDDEWAGLAALAADPRAADFLDATLLDVLGRPDDATLDQLAAAGATLGLPAAPAQLLRSVQAVNARWPGATGTLVRAIGEVYRYLHVPEVNEAVRAELCANLSGAQLVLAHSLGSVVAVDLLHRGEAPRVNALVTCGSPLAWTTVRRSLFGAGAQCPTLGLPWTNVHDPQDVVTAGTGLAAHFPEARDVPVNNGFRDAHRAKYYLRHPETGTAVATGLARAA